MQLKGNCHVDQKTTLSLSILTLACVDDPLDLLVYLSLTDFL